jgi:GT2 family glycosyltransferase
MPPRLAPDAGVEVVVAHRNNVPALSRLLTALRAQTRPCGVCVVDDASTDETPDVVPQAFPEARYERLDENVGFSRANNHGIRTSGAEWIVLLNNDTVPEPNFVEALERAWSAGGVDMVAATLRKPDGAIDSAGIEVDRSLVAFDLLHGRPYLPARVAALSPLAPCAGAGAYRRAALMAVGGFDEAMFAYLEDVDGRSALCRRAGHVRVARAQRVLGLRQRPQERAHGTQPWLRDVEVPAQPDSGGAAARTPHRRGGI